MLCALTKAFVSEKFYPTANYRNPERLNHTLAPLTKIVLQMHWDWHCCEQFATMVIINSGILIPTRDSE